MAQIFFLQFFCKTSLKPSAEKEEVCEGPTGVGRQWQLARPDGGRKGHVRACFTNMLRKPWPIENQLFSIS